MLLLLHEYVSLLFIFVKRMKMIFYTVLGETSCWLIARILLVLSDIFQCSLVIDMKVNLFPNGQTMNKHVHRNIPLK